MCPSPWYAVSLWTTVCEHIFQHLEEHNLLISLFGFQRHHFCGTQECPSPMTTSSSPLIGGSRLTWPFWISAVPLTLFLLNGSSESCIMWLGGNPECLGQELSVEEDDDSCCRQGGISRTLWSVIRSSTGYNSRPPIIPCIYQWHHWPSVPRHSLEVICGWLFQFLRGPAHLTTWPRCTSHVDWEMGDMVQHHEVLYHACL